MSAVDLMRCQKNFDGWAVVTRHFCDDGLSVPVSDFPLNHSEAFNLSGPCCTCDYAKMLKDGLFKEFLMCPEQVIGHPMSSGSVSALLSDDFAQHDEDFHEKFQRSGLS